ncbi:MAG TPA: chromosomal replication initiator protein DnaA [Aliidongia sp.]|uniref:chromosomal replication initiator protein DnaA n=1 Tax=Aliidongia sp. TaxID=1914230 RepID=UPI002DDD7F38|nr:chromosomal replication initiator protein DnaA [Aliidongia sp.]HEV2673865.1 chromosomal replication initiator protein DnaA [Aliidongia sp.]
MNVSEIDGPLEAQWQRVRGRLRDEFGEAAYRSWLSSLSLADLVEGAIRIEVPTRFLRDWVVAHYADRIRALWSGENRDVNAVEIVVGERRVEPTPVEAERAMAALVADEERSAERAEVSVRPVNAATVAPMVEPPDDREISAPLDQRFTFENFVVGKPNELAHAAARRVAESAATGNRAAPFNPLFLYGGVGLGKTHLMHAIAWHIRRQDPSRKVIYLSAEKFMYQFIKALRFKDTMAFKEQFRSVDVLMIDDVQFISGKDSTQEEFFHTFNALVDQNRQVIISADKSPSDLEGMEERMKSRLGWGLVADIHPTTYELRLGILQAKAELKQTQIPAKVLEFLAHKITSNVRELEGALTRITAHAQLVGRSITLESAQDVLHDLLRANDRRVTIEEIQKRVAEHFNIRLADMHSARRARAVARPRQVAMYLCKQLTPRSLPEIGRKFGGRDHTTVMHAVRKIEELVAADRALGEDIDLLKRMLET